MKFEFATAGRILFGSGSSEQLPQPGAGPGRYGPACPGTRPLSPWRGTECKGWPLPVLSSLIFSVDAEPTTHLVDEAAAMARRLGCDLVIAVGGGSVIDTGKAVAAMLTHPGVVLDYLELVGGGKPLVRPCVPFIAVPTTAGTGTEVTRNAVLGVPEHQVKASLRGYHLLPRMAVIDPELSRSLPPEITAYTGIDALTQLIEPFVSDAANPLTDGVCREGLASAQQSLAIAFHAGSDLAARQDMCRAALFSGIALANAKLGGMCTAWPVFWAGPLAIPMAHLCPAASFRDGGRYPGPARQPRSCRHVAALRRGCSNPDRQPCGQGCRWGRTSVPALGTELKIPPLRVAGLTVAECSRIIPTAQRASSMQGNPVKLSDEELLEILEGAI